MTHSHRRGPWSQLEDSTLMSLVHNQGALNWVRIASMLGSRTPKQCRERYHQNLKPTLNHDPITPEEGQLIERYVNEIGKRWAEIARRLRGRSDNAVKNWWNGSQNRRKR
ncbi:Homeodomain-like protein, partial [Cercophora newfieldiana]